MYNKNILGCLFIHVTIRKLYCIVIRNKHIFHLPLNRAATVPIEPEDRYKKNSSMEYISSYFILRTLNQSLINAKYIKHKAHLIKMAALLF